MGSQPSPSSCCLGALGGSTRPKKHEGLGLGRTLPPVPQQGEEFVPQTSWHTMPRCPKLAQLEM